MPDKRKSNGLTVSLAATLLLAIPEFGGIIAFAAKADGRVKMIDDSRVLNGGQARDLDTAGSETLVDALAAESLTPAGNLAISAEIGTGLVGAPSSVDRFAPETANQISVKGDGAQSAPVTVGREIAGMQKQVGIVVEGIDRGANPYVAGNRLQDALGGGLSAAASDDISPDLVRDAAMIASRTIGLHAAARSNFTDRVQAWAETIGSVGNSLKEVALAKLRDLPGGGFAIQRQISTWNSELLDLHAKGNVVAGHVETLKTRLTAKKGELEAAHAEYTKAKGLLDDPETAVALRPRIQSAVGFAMTRGARLEADIAKGESDLAREQADLATIDTRESEANQVVHDAMQAAYDKLERIPVDAARNSLAATQEEIFSQFSEANQRLKRIYDDIALKRAEATGRLAEAVSPATEAKMTADASDLDAASKALASKWDTQAAARSYFGETAFHKVTATISILAIAALATLLIFFSGGSFLSKLGYEAVVFLLVMGGFWLTFRGRKSAATYREEPAAEAPAPRPSAPSHKTAMTAASVSAFATGGIGVGAATFGAGAVDETEEKPAARDAEPEAKGPAVVRPIITEDGVHAVEEAAHRAAHSAADALGTAAAATGEAARKVAEAAGPAFQAALEKARTTMASASDATSRFVEAATPAVTAAAQTAADATTAAARRVGEFAKETSKRAAVIANKALNEAHAASVKAIEQMKVAELQIHALASEKADALAKSKTVVTAKLENQAKAWRDSAGPGGPSHTLRKEVATQIALLDGVIADEPARSTRLGELNERLTAMKAIQERLRAQDAAYEGHISESSNLIEEFVRGVNAGSDMDLHLVDAKVQEINAANIQALAEMQAVAEQAVPWDRPMIERAASAAGSIGGASQSSRSSLFGLIGGDWLSGLKGLRDEARKRYIQAQRAKEEETLRKNVASLEEDKKKWDKAATDARAEATELQGQITTLRGTIADEEARLAERKAEITDEAERKRVLTPAAASIVRHRGELTELETSLTAKEEKATKRETDKRNWDRALEAKTKEVRGILDMMKDTATDEELGPIVENLRNKNSPMNFTIDALKRKAEADASAAASRLDRATSEEDKAGDAVATAGEDKDIRDLLK